MIVIDKTSTNVTFEGHSEKVRHQTRIKNKHTGKWINACNIINYQQRNEPVKNRDRVKRIQINKCTKNKTITKSY